MMLVLGCTLESSLESPVNLTLSISPVIKEDEELTEVTLTVRAERDIIGASGSIILPEGLELVEGNLEWTADLMKNKPEEFKVLTKPVKEGNLVIRATTKNNSTSADLALEVEQISQKEDREASDATSGSAVQVRYDREPAPEWVLDKAKQHIISYIGEEYFNKHIFVKKSWTEPTVDKIGSKYRIYYDYKFRIKGDLSETSIEFPLFLNPVGNLVEYRDIKYRGPQKPYAFNISRNEAIEIAKENGLPISNITIMIERDGKTYNETKITITRIELGLNFKNLGINESYIWYLETEDYQPGKPEAVYVDVDSGKVLATYPKYDLKNESSSNKESDTEIKGVRVPFETISKDLFGGHGERAAYVITSSTNWEQLWRKINSIRSAIPVSQDINFEDEMIIAVFQGTFGSGHGIEIIRIIEEENSLEVLVEENLEPGGATVSTQPYHVIKTKRYYGNLTFADNRFPIVKSKLSGPLRVLKNGESTTYVINGRDYDVVTEIKGDPLRATFVMNGELFELKEGETHTSAGGLNVEVHNIEGNLVEFEIY